ncbi:MAG: hypothetical protein LUB61_06845 [Eggerthellaceae bacterium]|nr:hypothetical protein [Eggerthellaceae bacterium]
MADVMLMNRNGNVDKNPQFKMIVSTGNIWGAKCAGSQAGKNGSFSSPGEEDMVSGLSIIPGIFLSFEAGNADQAMPSIFCNITTDYSYWKI